MDLVTVSFVAVAAVVILLAIIKRVVKLMLVGFLLIVAVGLYQVLMHK